MCSSLINNCDTWNCLIRLWLFRAHDLIIDLIVIVFSQHLWCWEYLMKQLFFVSRLYPCTLHFPILLKYQIKTWVQINGEIVARLILIHVNVPDYQFVHIAFCKLMRKLLQHFKHLITFLVIIMEQNYDFLFQVLFILKISIKGVCCEFLTTLCITKCTIFRFLIWGHSIDNYFLHKIN